jgi:DNA mismatch endonuclease (patch repair protein)
LPDIVDAATRSRMMSGIRGRDTRPEVALRKALFARGFRYRLNVKDIAGKPDLVFPGKRAVVFVHGCFWHGHDCALFRLPATRREFWSAKIAGNRERDARVTRTLGENGWRVCTVWECALRGPGRLGLSDVAHRVATWLNGPQREQVLAGRPRKHADS